MRPNAQGYAALMECVRAGDDEAMGELIERYGPAMEQTARQLIGPTLQSQFDATDLVQSVQITLWVGLWTGRFSLPTPECLLALTRILLRRQVARHWRKAKSELSRSQDVGLDETSADRDRRASSQETDQEPGTDFNDLLEHFLGQLDSTDRRLVKLRVQGHTIAAAARLLNLQPGCLRMRMARLRTKFAGFFQELATRS